MYGGYGGAVTASLTVVRTLGRSDVAHDILAELPEWFGLEKYTSEYVEAADSYTNYVAASADKVLARFRPPSDGEPELKLPDALGILLLRQRFPTSAEVHLLAVRRAHHRAGIGRTLLGQVEADLRARGVRLLSVKTLGPSRPDPDGYDQTRAFYEACGFLPVEEFPDLWPNDPCLLMVKVL